MMNLSVEVEAAPVDAFDLAEPVDIRKGLPPEFHEWISSTKWKDRKNALDALLQNAKVPRIKEENYSDIMSTLGRCLKDANIVVVTAAAQCVEAIARGLRKPFGQYKNIVMMSMVEKLKERKPAVVEALSNAMDGIFTAVHHPYGCAYVGRSIGCPRRYSRRSQTQKSASQNRIPSLPRPLSPDYTLHTHQERDNEYRRILHQITHRHVRTRSSSRRRSTRNFNEDYRRTCHGSISGWRR